MLLNVTGDKTLKLGRHQFDAFITHSNHIGIEQTDVFIYEQSIKILFEQIGHICIVNICSFMLTSSWVKIDGHRSRKGNHLNFLKGSFSRHWKYFHIQTFRSALECLKSTFYCDKSDFISQWLLLKIILDLQKYINRMFCSMPLSYPRRICP